MLFDIPRATTISVIFALLTRQYLYASDAHKRDRENSDSVKKMWSLLPFKNARA